MKKLFSSRLLPLLTLGAGGLGLAMRVWLLGSGVDEKGLIITSHPANILCYILTAVTLLALLLCSLEPQAKVRKTVFSSPVASMVGCGAAAAGILVISVEELAKRTEMITILCCVLGVLAAGALVLSGVIRLRKMQPVWWLHLAVTLFFMFHLVSQYRFWSAEPEIHRFFFQLLASLFLMLAAYHRTTTDAGKSEYRRYLFTSQAALFFCCMCCTGASSLYYLTAGAWLLTLPAPRRTEQ